MPRKKNSRWYDAQGQKRLQASAFESTSGLRRLLSLIVLLFMVLILIQQTSDVKKVEKVATSIGLLPSNQAPAAIQVANGREVQRTSAPRANLDRSAIEAKVDEAQVDDATLEQITLLAANEAVQNDQAIWQELLKKADEPVLFALTRKLYGQTASAGTTREEAGWDAVAKWFADSQQQLEQWSQIEASNANDQPLTAEFSRRCQAASVWFASVSNLEPAAMTAEEMVSTELFRGLKLAVDQAILSRIVDNSPWKSTERVPFARSWQRVESLHALLVNGVASQTHFGRTEASHLFVGGQSYRGIPLRLEGTIFRIDPITRFSEEGLGAHEYHAVWLKPIESSNQPVCVYVPLNAIGSTVQWEKETAISVVGVFFKRIAYASLRGSEIAPLVLAASVQPIGPQNAEPNAEQKDAPNLQRITDKAPGGKNAGNPFAKLQNRGLATDGWRVPLDTATPYAMVSSSLQPVQSRINVDVFADGFPGANALDAVKPLLEMEKLEPEIDLLLSQKSAWPIAESIVLSRLSGVMTKVERISMDSHLPSLQDRSHLIRCVFEDAQGIKTLLCSNVPSAWLNPNGTGVNSLRQPCVVDALTLTHGDGKVVAWARSPRWKLFDTSASVEMSEWVPPLSEPQQFLLRNGWDLAWIELIRELEREQIRPLTSQELEPYFALMRLSHSSPYPASQALPNADPSPRLRDDRHRSENPRTVPELMEGFRHRKKEDVPAIERVAMNMRIVRVSRIPVDNPKHVAILGRQAYYQLDAMADIGDRTYEIKGDSESIVYHKEYPVTCVAIELPEWLAKPESGSDLAEQVWYPRKKAAASGWFYRFWSYKTLETSQSLGENRKQIGPLVVLDHLELGFAQAAGPPSQLDRIANNAVMVIGVLGTLGVWWFVRRSLKKTARR